MFESVFQSLVRRILTTGHVRPTRNGNTIGLFGATVVIGDLVHGKFPILQGRKMFHKGVLGELAAMLRQPKHIQDFEEWGCNYWKQWANEDGSINVDYGNAWFDFNGFNQIADLKDKLANNPMDRRMIISGWRPDALADLSLPCCHCLYQFYVNPTDNSLSMLWYQRSVDTMIGLPSDAVFAAAWLIAICHEFGFKPGKIIMNLGDCHIYEEHIEGAKQYLKQCEGLVDTGVKYEWTAPNGIDFCDFRPEYIELIGYSYLPAIKFELKS